MSEKTVNKKELAQALGVSAPYISKVVKQGRFDNCFTPDGKRLYLDKAISAYQKSMSRSNRAEKAAPKKDDGSVYNSANIEELDSLLKEEPSPLKQVQIVNQFWQGKTRRLDFLEAEGELIPVDDAKAAVDAVFTPINNDLDELPVSLRARFPDSITPDVENYIAGFLDDIKLRSEALWVN